MAKSGKGMGFKAAQKQIDDAQYVGDGAYLLKCGALVRFLVTATIH